MKTFTEIKEKYNLTPDQIKQVFAPDKQPAIESHKLNRSDYQHLKGASK